MGKKRVTDMSNEQEEKKDKAPKPRAKVTPASPQKAPEKTKPASQKDKEKKIVKSGKKHGNITDIGQEALEEAQIIEQKAAELDVQLAQKAQKTTKKKKSEPRKRGKKYQIAKKKIERTKRYPLPEAIKLLKETSIAKFKGSIDVHLVVKKNGLKGIVSFPYSTGKKQKARIADEKLLKELEAGKIDFTLLVTTPALMPKLAKYAKLLGPRGLMPNPKNNTITDKPEETIKRLTGSTNYKTEAKNPLIHLKIASLDQADEEIIANFKALIETIERKNIKKATLAPTMGPGIKVNLSLLK